MADTKAQIVISARDDTAGALAKAKAGFSNLQQEAAGVATSFAGVAASISAVLAGSGIAALLQNTVRSLDALNDLKDATGASIENISALEDVAARTGTSFETVSSSLVKFNQALNSAKPGSDIEQVFKAIGVDAARLKQIDPAEALQQTAKALAQFADDGNKARAAQELFGKSLKDVAPFLKDLAEAGQLNATVTTEQAQQAENFANALSRLAKNSEDARRGIVSGLLPLLNEIVESFNNGTKGAKDYSTAIDALRVPIEAIVITGANVAFVFKGVGREIGAIAAQLAALARGDFKQFSVISDEVKADAERARAELDAFEQRVFNAGRVAKDQLDAYDRIVNRRGADAAARPSLNVPSAAKAVSEFQKYLDKLNEAQVASLDLSAEEQARYDIAIGKLGKLNAAQEKQILLAAKALDLLKASNDVGPQIPLEELRRRNDAQKEVERLISQTSQGQLNELTKQYGYLDEALKNGSITAKQYVDALDIIDQKFGDLTKGAESAQKDISEFSKQAARNIQDAVGDTVQATLEGRFDSIAELWGNLVKKLIAQALAAKLNEALFGSLFGAGGQGTGLIGDLFGGFFASGGYLEPGKIGVVGERGPELIMAGASGTTVTPMAASGPSVNVTYSIGNIGSDVSRAEIVAGLNAVREQTRGEFMQVLRKRGVV